MRNGIIHQKEETSKIIYIKYFDTKTIVKIEPCFKLIDFIFYNSKKNKDYGLLVWSQIVEEKGIKLVVIKRDLNEFIQNIYTKNKKQINSNSLIQKMINFVEIKEALSWRRGHI